MRHGGIEVINGHCKVETRITGIMKEIGGLKNILLFNGLNN
jgi:hypothetical protein